MPLFDGSATDELGAGRPETSTRFPLSCSYHRASYRLAPGPIREWRGFLDGVRMGELRAATLVKVSDSGLEMEQRAAPIGGHVMGRLLVQADRYCAWSVQGGGRASSAGVPPRRGLSAVCG